MKQLSDFLPDLDQSVTTRSDLASFIDALRADLAANSQLPRWENASLDDFLEAMSAWIRDSAHLPHPDNKHAMMAQALWAATMYE